MFYTCKINLTPSMGVFSIFTLQKDNGKSALAKDFGSRGGTRLSRFRCLLYLEGIAGPTLKIEFKFNGFLGFSSNFR